jgi:hypothetical protein
MLPPDLQCDGLISCGATLVPVSIDVKGIVVADVPAMAGLTGEMMRE